MTQAWAGTLGESILTTWSRDRQQPYSRAFRKHVRMAVLKNSPVDRFSDEYGPWAQVRFGIFQTATPIPQKTIGVLSPFTN